VNLGGVRLRGSAAAYVLLEDAVILTVLVGAFAFSRFGSLEGLASLSGLVQVFALLLLVKGTFFACGLYDFRMLTARSEFWMKLGAGAVLAAALVWSAWVGAAGEGIAAAAFVVAFPPVVALLRILHEWASRSPRMRHRLLFLGAGRPARRTAREILDSRSR